jgi:hypothetical protein
MAVQHLPAQVRASVAAPTNTAFEYPAAASENPGTTTSGEPAMNTSTAASNPPTWYWVVSGLALLWMLFGVAAWVMDLMTDEAGLAQMSEGQRQLYAARPQWLFVVYGVAIFSGLGGAMGLLLRKSWATMLLGFSLAAIVIQFGYTLFVMNAVQALGASAAIPFPLAIFVIGVALVWFARRSRQLGWTGA